MLEATYQYLTDKGFARGEASANTQALARACVDQGLQRMVARADLDEIQEKGLLPAEWRDLILGSPDDEEVELELDALFARLWQTTGPVQSLLENGCEVCAASVSRPVENGDGKLIRRRARFLSDNEDVKKQYRWAPAVDAARKATGRAKSIMDESVRRAPQMASDQKTYVQRTQQLLQLELGL